MPIELEVNGDHIGLEVDVIAIAGFTGRDRAAVEAHLAELAEVGVPTPSATPCYYEAAPAALTQEDAIAVVGAETSGEAECVLIDLDGARYLTLGSDHTDRAAEAIDIALSKRVCPKPIARTAWNWTEVAGHIDRVELRSWISDDSGAEHMYQHGTIAEFMNLDEIYAGIPLRRTPGSVALFCGTLPAIGGIRPAPSFRAELVDPILGSSIELTYRTNVTDFLDT